MANRRIIKTYTLLEPLEDHGLTEIRWQKPIGATMRRLGITEVPGDQSVLLTNEMTDLPIAVLDQLDYEDAVLVSQITMDIIRKKSEAAKNRAKELGLPWQAPIFQETEARTPEEIEDSSPEEVAELVTSAEALAGSLRSPLEPASSV